MLIYDDRSVTVTTIPLKHRIPCCGFLFEEKQRPNHIIRDMVDFYKVPVYELNRIKNGADFVTPDGEVIPNLRLTRPSAPVRKYAYCSDTIYRPSLAEQIKNVDCFSMRPPLHRPNRHALRKLIIPLLRKCAACFGCQCETTGDRTFFRPL